MLNHHLPAVEYTKCNAGSRDQTTKNFARSRHRFVHALTGRETADIRHSIDRGREFVQH